MIRTLWKASAPLTFTGLVMLLILALSGVGLLVDSRIITGAPAWLKPAKFAISITVYTLTLAWIFTLLPEWKRLRAWVGWVTAVTMFIEIIVIDLQAFRGTTSHFNTRTPLDQALFVTMGVAILVAWLALGVTGAALFRQRLSNVPMGWAVRLGVLITILGAGIGFLMVHPAAPPLPAGAHTVGAPDGGPGMPGTGWSREHGDLRVAHFFGLHAIQILPLLVWLFGIRRSSIVLVAGAAYAALVVALLSQALAGHPFAGGAL